ncbi:MAG TPA: heme-binding domain-containing protein [Parafilimonas sp.]|nr:heme-binding domain-containing protein [Parafilimonas sp.]
MKKKLLVGFVILFIAIQAIQPAKNQGNFMSLNDITHTVSVPENVLIILKKSCYDCHSNYTNYPWFDRITPINHWVFNHVKTGKLELNFTEFGNYSAKKQLHKLKEIKETLEKDEMPLMSYTIMHPGTKLTNTQKNMLLDWTNKVTDEIRQRQNDHFNY